MALMTSSGARSSPAFYYTAAGPHRIFAFQTVTAIPATPVIKELVPFMTRTLRAPPPTSPARKAR
jgi:hypothetical protein